MANSVGKLVVDSSLWYGMCGDVDLLGFYSFPFCANSLDLTAAGLAELDEQVAFLVYFILHRSFPSFHHLFLFSSISLLALTLLEA